MPVPVPPEEQRTSEQLAEQYAIERELAARLRAAPDTRGLYSEVYDEFLRRVPHQPVLAQKRDPAAQRSQVELQSRLLRPLLTPATRFLEIGSGDSALALALAARVARVYAIEAAVTITAGIEEPSNLELIVTDAPPYPLATGAVDLAFSCHFLEHLRPDDALAHLAEVRRLLAPGGSYVCVTPNRLWGPHDISKYFTDTARGLHLREYSHGQLLRLCRRAGFAGAGILNLAGERLTPAAALRVTAVERLLALLPAAPRRRALTRLAGRSARAPLRLLEQVVVVTDR